MYALNRYHPDDAIRTGSTREHHGLHSRPGEPKARDPQWLFECPTHVSPPGPFGLPRWPRTTWIVAIDTGDGRPWYVDGRLVTTKAMEALRQQEIGRRTSRCTEPPPAVAVRTSVVFGSSIRAERQVPAAVGELCRSAT